MAKKIDQLIIDKFCAAISPEYPSLVECFGAEHVLISATDVICSLRMRIAELESQIPIRHDLRVDPMDLPDSGRNVWVLIGTSQQFATSDKAYYSPIYQNWIGWNGLTINNVIAWQELPRWEGML